MLEYHRESPTPQPAVWHALTKEAENWWPYSLGAEKGAKLVGAFEPGGKLVVADDSGREILFAFVMQMPDKAGFVLSRPIPHAERGFQFVSYELLIEGGDMKSKVIARADVSEGTDISAYCQDELELLVDNLLGYASQ